MSGEKSKKIGELGENVVSQFLERIGWLSPNENLNIPCLHPTKHRRTPKSKERQNHGLDFLVYLTDFLINGVQNTVIVSSKYTDNYSTPTSTFKNYLKDISEALECLMDNHEYGGVVLSDEIEDTNYTGVIFWLTHGEDANADVISQIENFHNSEDINYKSIYLVDNRRINFILDTLNFVRLNYPNARVEFVYHQTGRNVMSTDPKSGSVLPLHNINSSILPVKVITDNEEILVLSVIDAFEPPTLINIMGLSQDLTNGWGDTVLLCYPDYHEIKHGEYVKQVKRMFPSEDFVKKITVKSYRSDHKSLEV